jgi:hypothetical protein
MRPLNEGSPVRATEVKTMASRISSCERGEVDRDFGILAVIFLAGLYFMHLGTTQYYNAFGSVLASIIR